MLFALRPENIKARNKALQPIDQKLRFCPAAELRRYELLDRHFKGFDDNELEIYSVTDKFCAGCLRSPRPVGDN